MKKSLILAATALLGLAGFNAAAKTVVRLTGTAPATASQIQNGKQYLIYDDVKLEEDGTRTGATEDLTAMCFRGVREEDNVIIGNTSVNPSSVADLDARYYVWTAEVGADNAISFKNAYKNKYIPAAADAVMDLSDNAGKFTLVSWAPDNAFIVKNSANNNCWDGDNGGRNPSYRMVGWVVRGNKNDNHSYRFYEVTADMLVEINEYTGTVNLTDATVGNHTYTFVATHGTTLGDATGNIFAFSGNVSASDVVSDDMNVTATLASGIRPFKIVSARRRHAWATTTAAGMTLTANEESKTFADGEYFLDIPSGDYFKMFSVNQGKFFEERTTNVAGTPLPFASMPANAGQFTMIRTDYGAENIRCHGRQSGLNIQHPNVSWWTGSDIGSLWFMVYDENAYKANESFYSANQGLGEGLGGYDTNGQFYAAFTLAKTRQQQLNGKTGNEIDALNAAITAANSARFGVAGNDIESVVKALNDAIDALPIIDVAKAVYAERVGIEFNETDGTISTPGYVSATTAKALYDAIKSGVEADVTTALDALPSALEYKFTEGALYTLQSTDGDVRGYIVAHDGKVAASKADNIAFDATSSDFHFGFITIDGKDYMFSASQELFMNAFGAKTDNTWGAIQNAADYTWRLSEVPTQITKIVGFQNAKPHSFTLGGGLVPTNNTNFASDQTHEGGLSMIDSGTRSLLVTMGITNRGDGNGLYANYAGKLTAEQLEAIKAKVTSAHKTVADHVGYAKAIDEPAAPVINAFTYQTNCAISAEGVTTPDHQHSILFAENARHNITAGHVYTLVAADGKAWGVNTAGEIVLLDGITNDKTANWIAVANGEGFNLEHILTSEEEANISLMANTSVKLEGVAPSANYGKVTYNGQDYTMTKVSENAADATTVTGIKEINAGVANGTKVIYDLQGRRVQRATKGLYIINGVKTLVK